MSDKVPHALARDAGAQRAAWYRRARRRRFAAALRADPRGVARYDAARRS